MNAIELSEVSKSYTQFQLRDITLKLPAGTIMGLVGENGAGKSTLFRLILGMQKKDSGTISVLGEEDLRKHPMIKNDIGVVMDDVNLPAYLNIYETGKILQKIYSSWDQELFVQMIRKLQIPENTKFSELSRGNKMKAGFACALAHHPRLLLLDEATSGLDPVVRDDILDILMDFTKQEDHSVLISSHIVSDLEKACDYIAFLHQGNLIMVEEKDAIREKYGRLHCSEQELSAIPCDAIVGLRKNPYGAEVIVRRDMMPESQTIQPADIEELFVFMVKGEKI